MIKLQLYDSQSKYSTFIDLKLPTNSKTINFMFYETVDGIFNESIDKTVDESVNKTIETKTIESVNKTIDGIFNKSIDKTNKSNKTNKPIDGILQETVPDNNCYQIINTNFGDNNFETTIAVLNSDYEYFNSNKNNYSEILLKILSFFEINDNFFRNYLFLNLDLDSWLNEYKSLPKNLKHTSKHSSYNNILRYFVNSVYFLSKLNIYMMRNIVYYRPRWIKLITKAVNINFEETLKNIYKSLKCIGTNIPEWGTIQMEEWTLSIVAETIKLDKNVILSKLKKHITELGLPRCIYYPYYVEKWPEINDNYLLDCETLCPIINNSNIVVDKNNELNPLYKPIIYDQSDNSYTYYKKISFYKKNLLKNNVKTNIEINIENYLETEKFEFMKYSPNNKYFVSYNRCSISGNLQESIHVFKVDDFIEKNTEIKHVLILDILDLNIKNFKWEEDHLLSTISYDQNTDCCTTNHYDLISNTVSSNRIILPKKIILIIRKNSIFIIKSYLFNTNNKYNLLTFGFDDYVILFKKNIGNNSDYVYVSTLANNKYKYNIEFSECNEYIFCLKMYDNCEYLKSFSVISCKNIDPSHNPNFRSSNYLLNVNLPKCTNIVLNTESLLSWKLYKYYQHFTKE